MKGETYEKDYFNDTLCYAYALISWLRKDTKYK